jgi:hypothetical protein
MIRILGFTVVFVSVVGSALGALPAAPEIDATSGVAALGLLCGGILILRSRTKTSLNFPAVPSEMAGCSIST